MTRFSRLTRLAFLAAVLALAAAPALAAHRRLPCSPGAGRFAPRLLTPCRGATVRAGSAVTFLVRDANPNARRFHPYLIVALSRHTQNGELTDTGGGRGLFVKLAAVRGHPGLFRHSTRGDVLVPFPGYWLDTPRTYRVQVAQIDSSAAPYGDRYSPIEKLIVR